MTDDTPPAGTAALIDGKSHAAALRIRIAAHVEKLTARSGVVPGLAVVLVGTDPASEVYVRSKARATLEAGMRSYEHRLPRQTTTDELLTLIARINADEAVHGILVQLPLPDHIDAQKVIGAVLPAKDVDGFHVSNAGLLATGQRGIVPCTPWGCLMLLREEVQDFAGLEAVVVGRSNIVGKPMAQMLLMQGCTVTIAHSRTRNLADVCRRADILVAAAGRPQMIKGDWLKPNAVVIDVGINRIESDGRTALVGDVDLQSAIAVAKAITPVPGGVGPMTIACLLANTLVACCNSLQMPIPDGLSV